MRGRAWRTSRKRGKGSRRDSGFRTTAGIRAGARPRRRFAQHFLEQPWVDKLLDVMQLSAEDTFLEIGPGRGVLTRPLAARVRRVIAVEIDRDLAAALPDQVGPNVRVVQSDFLDLDLANALGQERAPVRVVGNLPYNVSSPVLFKLLHSADEGRFLADAIVMLQKEVADRLVARPGRSDYGVLAIQVGLLADVERLLTLPPGAFRPAPTVTSSVVRLRFRPAAAQVGSPAVFERVVRGVFLHRRKTLLNALQPVVAPTGLSALEVLERTRLDPSRRPQTLTVTEMARLAQAVL